MTQMHIPGIDVSQYQGLINWRKLRNTGIGFVYIRALNGLKEDLHVSRNCLLAAEVKLPFGIYIYFHPEMNPVKQANRLVSLHRKYGCTLVPQIDVEERGGLEPEDIVRSLRKICNIVAQELDCIPVIYTGSWFWNAYVKSDEFGDMPLWAAEYVLYSYKDYKANPVPMPHQFEGYIRKFRKRRKPVIGWKTSDVWQFSAKYNGVGAQYGVESLDLDLNIASDKGYNRLVIK